MPGKRSSSSARIDGLVARIRACRLCRDAPTGRPLPHEPRPVLRMSDTARIAVCGQAPGTRVHASGVPFSDPSGVRLRSWMGVSESEFYDAERIAIVPMGFCFPGLDVNGGDLPPRPECAPAWRSEVFEAMPRIELVLLVGRYAQLWHLGRDAGTSMSAAVAEWRQILDDGGGKRMFPLPHPSWRNNAWLSARPWFETELLPALRREVRQRV